MTNYYYYYYCLFVVVVVVVFVVVVVVLFIKARPPYQVEKKEGMGVPEEGVRCKIVFCEVSRSEV